jgi:hypothetical protein
MPHDPALVAEVRGWLSKAGEDLAAAQYELKADPPFSEDIVFHSQQAAEKFGVGVLAGLGKIAFTSHRSLQSTSSSCAVERLGKGRFARKRCELHVPLMLGWHNEG